jgi:hypothetical protein
MDPTFAHPHWIVAGVLLILGGMALFRWARRNDNRAAMAVATTEAAFSKFRKKSPGKAPAEPATTAKTGMAARFRNSMAQFLGIVGVLAIIAGLVALIFGAFYPAG